MDTNLSQVNRAASHAVANALAPKNSSTQLAKTASGVRPATSSAAARSTAAPAATGATSSTASSSANASATITSSDFLTLLVSELKNQDPTQPTDPNAYITQLVGVNSLEQLIQINTGITSLDTATSGSTTSSGSTGSTGSASPVASTSPAISTAPASSHKTTTTAAEA